MCASMASKKVRNVNVERVEQINEGKFTAADLFLLGNSTLRRCHVRIVKGGIRQINAESLPMCHLENEYLERIRSASTVYVLRISFEIVHLRRNIYLVVVVTTFLSVLTTAVIRDAHKQITIDREATRVIIQIKIQRDSFIKIVIQIIKIQISTILRDKFFRVIIIHIIFRRSRITRIRNQVVINFIKILVQVIICKLYPSNNNTSLVVNSPAYLHSASNC